MEPPAAVTPAVAEVGAQACSRSRAGVNASNTARSMSPDCVRVCVGGCDQRDMVVSMCHVCVGNGKQCGNVVAHTQRENKATDGRPWT